MASLLRVLSAAFVAAGVGVGAYAYLHSEAGDKLRPQIAAIVGQGKIALKTLADSANAIRKEPKRQPYVEADQAKLPFIVIEEREFGGPSFKMPPPRRLADAAPAAPTQQLSELRIVQSPDQAPMDLNPVEARLRAKVPVELIGYFDLFLYVSKATPDKGEWAQRMFVLAKQHDQVFAVVHNWRVSTGMEKPIPSPSGTMMGTHTPTGMFKLDRDRFYKDYTSRQWDSPMPHAMFFDWKTEGRTSGLAIHGSDSEGEKELGNRASHGCIRLSAENAKALYQLVQQNYRGRVPEFAIDLESGTMSTAGVLVRDEQGRPKMSPGYKVLVFIEDYGGPSVDTVASLF